MSQSEPSSAVEAKTLRESKTRSVRPPSFTSQSIKTYFKTRFSSLFVSKEERSQYGWAQMLNPFGNLKYMTARNWNYFMLGFLAWTWDMFDFCAVALNAVNIAHALGKSVRDVTWGITLVLMLRSVGAFAFGWWGDRHGRKWPCIVNLSLLVILQCATGFVKTYEQFLGVRALFGISMGGIYGFALATALDDSPVKSRGALSGIYQVGSPFGYLLAVVFNRAITNNSPHGWRALFWFSAGPPVILIVWRFLLPETDAYVKQKAAADEKRQLNARLKWYQLSDDTKNVFKRYWLVMLYCIILTAAFNFMSHGSSDLFPTYLTQQLGYNKDRSAVTNSVAKLGAMLGGCVAGHTSTFVGRRLTIMIFVIIGAAMIYPWMYSKGTAINAGVFFLQASVQGAWGVVPIFLSELAPPANRALVVGLTYQLGNLIASGCSTILSGEAQKYPIVNAAGKHTYNYAKVMSVFEGCIFACVFVIVFLGPENRGALFDVNRDKVADEIQEHRIEDEEATGDLEKAETMHVEHASIEKAEVEYVETACSENTRP